MGLGDFLRDAYTFASPAGSFAARMVETMSKDEEPVSGSAFFKAAGSTAVQTQQSFGGALEKAVRAVPGGGALMDAPSRTWDTMFISAAHADSKASGSAVDRLMDSNFWGAIANRDTWGKAWSSWGEEDHVTAGQIFASRAFADEDGIRYADPLAANQAKAIQNAAGETWYGEVLAAATDLSYSMMVPGLGTGTAALKASRAARSIDTAVEAEEIALRFAETGGDGAKVRKMGDVADGLLNKPKNQDSLIGRMVENAKSTHGIRSIDGMLDHLGPMMENSTDSAKVIVSDIWTQANKLDDPDLATQVKVNALLAVHGSGTARDALVRDFPLLAKNLENMTGTPRDIALADDLLTARLSGASDDTTNGVLRRFYNTPADEAELDLLRDELDKAMSEAQSARDLRASTRPGSEDRALAEQMVREADEQVDVARQQKKTVEVERRWNDAEANSIRAGVDRANEFLTRIQSLGTEGTVATGRVAPTALDTVKTRLRQAVGEERELHLGDGIAPLIVKALPTRAARFALAPQARGSISLVDTELGVRQLEDVLRRSKAFSSDEIRRAKQELLITPAARRQDVIARHQQETLERIAMRHFGDGRTPEEALKHAREITQAAVKEWGQGNEWVATALNEQKGKGKIIVRTPDGQRVAYDEAMLQSQLADNAPMLDPEVFENAIKADASNLRKIGQGAIAFNDAATALWKHGALLRPGLAVRAALDTNMRAAALMGSAATFMAAVDGTANLFRNGKTATQRIIDRGDIAAGATRRLHQGMRPVTVEVGNGRKVSTSFHRDADEMTRNQLAMTKGADAPWKFYLTETQKHLSRFRSERASWGRFDPDSPHWVSAYLEYGEQLLASPTARWLVQHGDEPGDTLHALLESADFAKEYAKVGRPKGYTRREFAEQVAHEVDLMFGEAPHLADAIRTHTLTPKMVERAFPRQARFRVPGPDRGAFGKPNFVETFNGWLGQAYRLLLDKPDMWLARNPAGSAIYRRSLQREAEAIRRAYPDGNVPEQVLASMDARARTEAISTVRRTFFDTTRNTAMHEKVARISPFFAAWEDAMISWARLIHDDPRRLVRLAGAYNAAGTLNPYLPQPLLVDNEGKPVRRGQDSENGKYIALPVKVGGVENMRVRLEALNSIAQGETWWLPGFGPQVTVGVSQVLGRFVPDDVVLDIVGTDHWLGKQVMKSMFLNGELPRTDVSTTLSSLLPSSVRNLYRDTLGDNFAMNVQRNLNQQIAEATREGRRLNDRELNKMRDRAERTAWNAAVVRLVSGGGLGMTGTATVEGQFYVEQMRTIEAMPSEELKAMGFNTPEEYFAHLHPEAADLPMNLSRNETGINASVNAQKSASKLKGVLKDHPEEYGWMVVGAANVNQTGEDDFSSTAYAMQQTSGDRKKMSVDEVEKRARAAVGWKQYRNLQYDLGRVAEQIGVKPNDPVIAEIRREAVAMMLEENSAWADAYTTRTQRFPKELAAMRALSKDRRVAGRSDMVLFREYDEQRQALMDHFGLASLQGTGAESMAAKETLRELGQQMAADNIGFEQLWNRVLSSEVEDAAPATPGQPEAEVVAAAAAPASRAPWATGN